MGREPYKYRIKLSGKEKRELRRAKKKGRKDARLVIRILIILWASEGRTIAQTAELLAPVRDSPRPRYREDSARVQCSS